MFREYEITCDKIGEIITVSQTTAAAVSNLIFDL